jgi:hypothetical protein
MTGMSPKKVVLYQHRFFLFVQNTPINTVVSPFETRTSGGNSS